MAYFKYKNKNIYYNIVGEGKPLLILNGIMMSTKSWEVFVEDFSCDYMFIRLDFLDQGQSDSSLEAYSQDLQVDVLYELIKSLNLEKVNIAGISYGGEVALAFAVKYQEVIDKLIVFNAVSHTNDILVKTGRLWNKLAQERNYLEYYNQTIPIIYSEEFINNNQEWMEKRKEVLLNGPFRNHTFLDRMIRLTNSAESFDVREKLVDLKIPVLIVGSSDDRLTPLSCQEDLHKLIPTSRLIILPKVGHASMYEVPDIFVSLIKGYFSLTKHNYTI